MAADPNPEWLSCLPSSWSYGVTRDGRIFFINEEAKSTTWLHPVTGEAVITGHRKTPDLPTGWEEGYTFEGARCFINHNERKVTCKHPVSGVPSQDNCIFVVNEHVSYGKLVHPDKPVENVTRSAPKALSEQDSSGEKKDRPMSTMSEASNYTGGSDYSTFPGSPATTNTTTNTTTSSARPSRSSKKIHNFGKRSNSIKRNPNAPVVKSNWLYKQDSAGMKLWKRRWFVLSDMCLFYYRDEKEEAILGSILLPSFHISMLSVDDHISKKYAFKATHPNMRTYYFCTDTPKDMESWMKCMTDAALVHTEPIRRLDKLKVDQRTPQELNNLLNHRVLTRPEIQNNERNREPARQKDLEKHNSQREREYYTLQRDGERYSLRKDGVSYTLQRDGERYLLHKDGERYTLRKDGDKYSLQRDGEVNAVCGDPEKYGSVVPPGTEEKYAPPKDSEKYLVAKDGERYALQRVGDRHTLHREEPKYVTQKEVKRQLSLKEDNRYGTIQVLDRYGTLKEVKKYATLREGDKYATLREAGRYAMVRDGEKHGLQREPSTERATTKISSIKLQPAQAAAIAAAVSASRQGQAGRNPPHKAQQVDGSAASPGELAADCSPGEVEGTLGRAAGKTQTPSQEPERGLSRTDSMQQLENWVRTHRTRGPDDDTRSITSYQTLPRNMPSHRAQIVPRYPEGYRTLPRNSMMRPDSICSVAGSVYDRALRPTSTVTTAEKRRSMRDDTMWQLYEWQQRQAFSRQSLAQPPGAGHYGTLPSTKTMGNISEHTVAHSIPTSPSHGSLALYSTFSPPRPQQGPHNVSSHSEVSSPVLQGDVTLDRRHRTHLAKYGYPPDRRSMPAGILPQTITPQSLQGKTPEELTLLLIKLRRQQAELNSLREHTVAQLMTLGLEGPNAKISPDEYRENSYVQRMDEVDIDTKLSRLCEQDKAVRMQEDKLQQLHREKHTLETALLSASQELSEQGSTNPAATQSLIQQRDVLQNGLLSTCRELSRVNTELERSWRDYDRLEADVTLAKTNLLEQLEALGSPQTEPPSQKHVQIQKELWRIQDVMEALAKSKPQRSTDSSFPGCKPLSSLQKNEAPDYRLYKSEPELTTVKEEVDEANGEDKAEPTAENKEMVTPKAVPPYPVGIVPPRTKSPMSPPESSTIASYVTLRKTKKPEPRSDRPRSAVDHMGIGEREVGRTRMSVEEQLERMRRNQQAALRDKKRETPSRSPSFSRDNPFVILQSRPQGGLGEGSADPTELEAALQQLELSRAQTMEELAHMDRAKATSGGDSGQIDRTGDRQQTGIQKVERAAELRSDQPLATYSDKTEMEAESTDDELCESQRVVILDLCAKPQRVEIVSPQSFEEENMNCKEPTCAPAIDTNKNSPKPETLTPQPKEEREEPGLTLAGRQDALDPPSVQNATEGSLEKSINSYNQLATADRKHNNTNNNMVAAQTFALVSSDI
ncbi:pleckstrin homology domain-containing family A member 5-like isoform X2 [Lampris incognitus]|uniref:pleckstrin homology domain-containing family A member 5-like isoform X2 n=1 Tax=Lampris incognitus TaxID=2546036 RepID=UPI0024B4E950|nr:pleckstrin homology domain-containing family A member 5-like isoform X2 [Lampris incognitus]